ncbi:hypothetical protein [uncultured Rhodoblastus sp.]|uniref:hypothetical protein n=1 Tax=uncultured Rhodoblastus sp. TaxID=543037 RepID=UPI0025DBD7B9|nr:hypothetical protein [uncultured Rhodoblastus sp.]
MPRTVTKRGARVGAQLPGQVEAANSRRPGVAQQQCRVGATAGVERGQPVRHENHVKTRLSPQAAKAFARKGVAVGDHDERMGG